MAVVDVFPTYAAMGSSTNQFNYPILFNDLNSNDRSFLKDLIRKFGAENYGLWNLLMGRTGEYVTTENKQYYHYEKRELQPSVTVANTVSATGAGNDITILVSNAVGNYYVDGTCPARIGEEVNIESSNILCTITAIPVTTANAWQVTLTPNNTSETIASVGGASLLAGELISFRGRMNVGEASTTGTGLYPVYDKIYNTTTEQRDDFTVTDFALIEKQEVFTVNGQQYYTPLALDDMNRRFMNQMFWAVLESNGANNLGNGTYGTIGVQPRVEASGSTIYYQGGNPQISDFQTLSRALNFYGSPGDYHLLFDFYSKQSITNTLFQTFKQTFNLVNWESVGGSKEAAVAYGFDYYRDNNINFFMGLNPLYNPEMILKRATAANLPSFYQNYGLCIPQRINQDVMQPETSYPSFQIVFQMLDGQRMKTWDYGAMAMRNQTGTMNYTISMESIWGVRVIAANQYALFIGQ